MVRFRSQLIIDSRLPVHDPRDLGPVTGSRYTTKIECFEITSDDDDGDKRNYILTSVSR